ncbi:hypothetical protein HDU76_011386, partial [Blyttiomyces sp. JEL0837]
QKKETTDKSEHIQETKTRSNSTLSANTTVTESSSTGRNVLISFAISILFISIPNFKALILKWKLRQASQATESNAIKIPDDVSVDIVPVAVDLPAQATPDQAVEADPPDDPVSRAVVEQVDVDKEIVVVEELVVDKKIPVDTVGPTLTLPNPEALAIESRITNVPSNMRKTPEKVVPNVTSGSSKKSTLKTPSKVPPPPTCSKSSGKRSGSTSASKITPVKPPKSSGSSNGGATKTPSPSSKTAGRTSPSSSSSGSPTSGTPTHSLSQIIEMVKKSTFKDVMAADWFPKIAINCTKTLQSPNTKSTKIDFLPNNELPPLDEVTCILRESNRPSQPQPHLFTTKNGNRYTHAGLTKIQFLHKVSEK